MNKVSLNFHIFENQWEYLPSNPNWTGQTQGVGPYTQLQDLSPEMKTFYDMKLIQTAEPKMVHDQFGQKRPIPAGNGKTIEFRKFNALPAVPADRELVEGVTPNGQNYGVTAITATVKQYGGYVTISDMLNLTAYDHQMKEIMRILGTQAGKVSDIVTRDILATGTNVLYANGVADRANVADALSIKDIKKAVAILKRYDCEPIDGSYIAIVHPDVVYDLMNDSEWIDANHYAGSQKIFNGEIGKMYGVRFVETTMAKKFEGEGAGGKDVYGTLLLGADAYGVTSINGGGIETIVKQLGSGGSSDPLNQRATAGWKLNKTACILTDEYMIRVESLSTLEAESGDTP